ncbi:MAG: hypothetical protein LBH29_07535, partial [Elusimicrobiota bacterium]|nr:hypothetical protein [Elusimicrobiota bacterium]
MNNKGQNGFDLINNKGQTLYYFLILMMLVFISWAMMLNIAKVIIERMKLQNEVDNIALSIAVDKARVMNFVGGCNYLIGSILASGTKPEFIQIPAYNTDAVAAYQNGDYKKNGGTRDGDVKKIKLAVEALQNAQDAALISHLAYQDYLIAKSVSKESALLIMPFAGLPSKTNAQ